MNVILNLLLVEDNPSDADLIKELLEGNPFIAADCKVVTRLSGVLS